MRRYWLIRFPVNTAFASRVWRAHNISLAQVKNDGLTKCFDKGDFSGQHQVEQTFSYLTALTSLRLVVPDVRIYLTNTEKKEAEQRIKVFFPRDKVFMAFTLVVVRPSVAGRWKAMRN